MNYLLVKNIKLRYLLAPSGEVVPWEKYGFNSMVIDGYCGQGWDSSDKDTRNHVTVIPISEQELFDSKLESLQDRINTDLFPDHSIEVIEDNEATVFKNTIKDVRDGII